ncbi:MAG: hypothetical protein H7A23_05320 [Leptospiraceae bacterium]|nr:hypothetical protein [Leptospiraceae bacterium]MCP5493956.1 hypothetical protein [Leptospiraceae bacterium]
MVTNTVKTILEIATLIKEENVRGKDKVPTSERFIHQCAKNFNISEEEVRLYLNQLQENHFIFIIELVRPDPKLFIQSIEGYIFAEVSILNELRHELEKQLIKQYESTMYKRKSSFQIIKELYPRVKEFNNTPLGRLLILNVMVEEYQKIVNANGFEYSDNWKKEKLFKLYRYEEDASENQDVSDFDNDNFSSDGKFDPSNSKWGRAVNQFGVEFLVRIHFRRYEFDLVRKLIMTEKISQLKDFLFIRKKLKELEERVTEDPILSHYFEQIVQLRRLAQAKINIIRKSETIINSSAK